MTETLPITEPTAPQSEGTTALVAVTEPTVTDTELLRLIADNSAKQCDYAKKQLMLVKCCTAFIGLFLAITIILAGLFVPRVNNILKQADEVLANTKIMSDELAGVDYSALIANLDALIDNGDTGIAQALANVERALGVIEQFDIKTLNSAIADLSRVVSPIANIFGGKR